MCRTCKLNTWCPVFLRDLSGKTSRESQKPESSAVWLTLSSIWKESLPQ